MRVTSSMRRSDPQQSSELAVGRSVLIFQKGSSSIRSMPIGLLPVCRRFVEQEPRDLAWRVHSYLMFLQRQERAFRSLLIRACCGLDWWSPTVFWGLIMQMQFDRNNCAPNPHDQGGIGAVRALVCKRLTGASRRDSLPTVREAVSFSSANPLFRGHAATIAMQTSSTHFPARS